MTKRINTTEWEEIQYKFGNKVGKYETHEKEILEQRIADASVNSRFPIHTVVRNDSDSEHDSYSKEKNEYAGTEDREDDDLGEYRRKRIAQMQHAKVYHVYGPNEYVKSVTESSKTQTVFAALINDTDKCKNLVSEMQRLCFCFADRYSFVVVHAKDAVPGFPAIFLPCALIYKEGKMIKQIMNCTSVESALEDAGLD